MGLVYADIEIVSAEDLALARRRIHQERRR